MRATASPGGTGVRGKGTGEAGEEQRGAPSLRPRYRGQTDVGEGSQPEVDVVCVTEMQAGRLKGREEGLPPCSPGSPRAPPRPQPGGPGSWGTGGRCPRAPPGQMHPPTGSRNDDPAARWGGQHGGGINDLVGLTSKAEHRAGVQGGGQGWGGPGVGDLCPGGAAAWPSPQAPECRPRAGMPAGKSSHQRCLLLRTTCSTRRGDPM